MQLIIGVLLALALFWGLRQWRRSSSSPGGGWLQGGVISVLGVALLAMVVMGRVQMVVVLAVAALVFWRPLSRLVRELAWSGDAVRTLETSLLRIQVNDRSGGMRGWLKEADDRLRDLDTLDEGALRELHERARRHHADSVGLLEAYLAQRLGKGWQGSPGQATMSEAEACAILGVAADASREAIVAAHRRLIQKLHPDRGGSDYLAARINEAKDVLLARFGGGA